MELYVGGTSQGKLNYVLQKKLLVFSHDLVCDGATCDMADIFTKPILNHFHLLIKRMLEETDNMENLLIKIKKDNPSVIIICNEVGAGIVPIDKNDRFYREVVGRCCCTLAKNSDIVEKVVCGMGLKLK